MSTCLDSPPLPPHHVVRDTWSRPARSGAAMLPLVVLLVSACGGEGEAAGSTVTVTDSAGIQIVESDRPAWSAGEEWRVSTDPILEIGMAEGPEDYLLSRVRAARRLADGSIAVANSQSAEIRIFAADGRHMRTIGRQGGGPGEFENLFWMHTVRGDSILAYDHIARRLSVFSPDGRFVGANTIGGGEQESLPRLIGTFEDGSLAAVLVDFRGFTRPTGEVGRMPELYVRFAGTGEFLDTLSSLPGGETYMESSRTSGGMEMVAIRPPIFGHVTVSALVNDRLVLGSNDSYELQVAGPDGTLERLIRRRVQPRPVTEQLLEAARREEVASAATEEQARRREEALRSAPHSSTVPFYESLMGDDEGNLWVQEFTVPGEDPPGWAIYGPEGKLLGSVHLPDDFRPTHFGGDFVLGVWRDKLEVERVRMYALEKGDAR
jgi:hypothetical protein